MRNRYERYESIYLSIIENFAKLKTDKRVVELTVSLIKVPSGGGGGGVRYM